MSTHFITVDGTRIPHTGIKVWYVMCGTEGKQVEWAWLVGPGPDNRIEVLSATGGRGWCTAKTIFFTRVAAVNDWRRRAAAETTEHADALIAVADELYHKADRIRTMARPVGPFHDL